MIVFFFFPNVCLLLLALLHWQWAPAQCCIETVRRETFCHVPNFRGKMFSFFLPLSMIFLSVWKFYSSYLSVLNHKKMLDFGKCFLPFFFFCIFWDDHMGFLFSLLTWGITLLISLKVKPTLHSRDKCYLVMMYYAFYIFLDLIC